MAFENTLRYSTFADRSQVESRIESYENIMVPSHLLIGGENAVPPLIHQLYESGEIEFYIDPAITEFHRGRSFRDNGEIKAWHQKLVNTHGEPLINVMRRRMNLVYDDLNAQERTGIVESVVELQEDFVQRAVEEKMGKYESTLIEDINPRAVIPWYLKMSDFEDLEPNREIIRQSNEFTSLPIKPCFHVDKSFISDINARQDIVNLASEAEVPEVFIWVDGLNKRTTEVEEYIDVIRFIVEFLNADIRPHALYGDFFCNLLAYFGLRGIGFGTYHSEDKAEQLESGTFGNLQRYYFNPVKDFLSIPDAAELGEEYDAEVPEHSGLISWSRLYRLGEDHDFLKNHFIRTKHEHRIQILTTDLDDVIDELEQAYETYNLPLSERETIKTAEHLDTWVTAINQYQEEYPAEAEEAIETAHDRLTSGRTQM